MGIETYDVINELRQEIAQLQKDKLELEGKLTEGAHESFRLGQRYGLLTIDNLHLREALAKATAATEFTMLRQANMTREQEWGHDSAEGFGMLFYAVAMGGEAGEALNVVKKLERERLGARGSRATIADLAQEMADTVIYMDLLAWKCGQDLWAAIRKTFNDVSEREGFMTRLP